MSTPRYDWWPYVKGMIRRYPELCRREADLHTTAVTPNYGGAPGGHGGRSDPVANAALRSLPSWTPCGRPSAPPKRCPTGKGGWNLLCW